MNYLHVLLLAIVQGAAELLPVSSSAHVIVAEKLLGLDPSAPELTFLLVMLHAGTMLAVIQYFWPRWRDAFFAAPSRRSYAWNLVLATALTGALGLGLKVLIEKVVLGANPDAEVEHLFKNLPLMAGALAAAGVVILVSGRFDGKGAAPLTGKSASAIGLVQGLCLPFRGFSRSGATISTGLALGLSRGAAEEFSFALAVLLTPPVVLLELRRLVKQHAHFGPELLLPGLAGMALAFVAGAIALRLLSRALETGRFHLFGYYCFGFAAVVLACHFRLGG
ncbi:MAG TPA: undecaprenyl-diphosphate phosphatase [Planctomycetota bacterium]|nr:undecaprenyl-diphosphate phosphatase [Planctomycetota bacterium]